MKAASGAHCLPPSECRQSSELAQLAWPQRESCCARGTPSPSSSSQTVLAACGTTAPPARSGTRWGGIPSAHEYTAACEQWPACLGLCTSTVLSSCPPHGCRVSVRGICRLSVGRGMHTSKAAQQGPPAPPSAQQHVSGQVMGRQGHAGFTASRTGEGSTMGAVHQNIGVFKGVHLLCSLRMDARTQKKLAGSTATEQGPTADACAAACEQGPVGWSTRGPAVCKQAAWQHCVRVWLIVGQAGRLP